MIAAQMHDTITFAGVAGVDISGFTKDELNQQYILRQDMIIHDQATYWDSEGSHFMYWQKQVGHWSICFQRGLEEVKAGGRKANAHRSDNLHFANACGWMEFRDQAWTSADRVKITVVNSKSEGANTTPVEGNSKVAVDEETVAAEVKAE